MGRDKSLLCQLQALPLSAKILLTEQRIREWYNYFYGDVYVSFSGGKDSTVLAHIVHKLYPDVPLVFANTGLEYPEIQSFARNMGAEFIRPKMRFDEVISKYGYPLISKEVAEAIHFARRIVKRAENPESLDFVERERERVPCFARKRTELYGTRDDTEAIRTRRDDGVQKFVGGVEPSHTLTELPSGDGAISQTQSRTREPRKARAEILGVRHDTPEHGTQYLFGGAKRQNGDGRTSAERERKGTGRPRQDERKWQDITSKEITRQQRDISRIERARKWLMGKD